MKFDPIDILKAIRFLRPKAEVTIIEDDLSTLNWIVVDGDIPSDDEIIDAIFAVKKEEENEIKTKELKKLSAKQKLKDLGLDADEVQALLG